VEIALPCQALPVVVPQDLSVVPQTLRSVALTHSILRWQHIRYGLQPLYLCTAKLGLRLPRLFHAQLSNYILDKHYTLALLNRKPKLRSQFDRKAEFSQKYGVHLRNGDWGPVYSDERKDPEGVATNEARLGVLREQLDIYHDTTHRGPSGYTKTLGLPLARFSLHEALSIDSDVNTFLQDRALGTQKRLCVRLVYCSSDSRL
jgi:hypothetical protein